MKTKFFRLLARINKALLPSYSKKGLDLVRASKLQMAIIGWRLYVTKRTGNMVDNKNNSKKKNP